MPASSASWTLQKAARYEALLDASKALTTYHSIPDLLRRVAQHLHAVVPFDDIAVLLSDEQTRLRVALVEPEAELRPLLDHVASADGAAVRVFATSAPFAATLPFDGPHRDREALEFYRNIGGKAICIFPLIAPTGTLGTIVFGSRGAAPYGDDAMPFLLHVAGHVAAALANAEDFDELVQSRDALTATNHYLEHEVEERSRFGDIIGDSRALRRVLRAIEKVAPTDATVLLLGETGTGKELLARAVHRLSPRASHTFVTVAVAALPAALVESELFGHEKGAFTGAVGSRAGRLELAHRGTLFLDEIGDLPMALQPKLLRAIQEREVERLGATRVQKVDVRFIAATNRELEHMVAEGTFRADLYYRLNVVPIRVPPLRDRREDIPALAEYFMRKYAIQFHRNVTMIPPRTMAALQRWEWPGNVRELQNVIERAVILSGGPALDVPLADLQPRRRPGGPALPLAESERRAIIDAIRGAGGKIGGTDGAAARLGLKRTTLQSRMRKLGIH